jgi:hypothetical protein
MDNFEMHSIENYFVMKEDNFRINRIEKMDHLSDLIVTQRFFSLRTGCQTLIAPGLAG